MKKEPYKKTKNKKEIRKKNKMYDLNSFHHLFVIIREKRRQTFGFAMIGEQFCLVGDG